MDLLVNAFDQPIDSQEHRDLAATAWMGGELISVRYWLGRLLRRNFFRESNEAVKDALRDYFVRIGCEKGASLVADLQSWSPIAILLQHEVEAVKGCGPTKNARLVAALKAVMANPDLTDSQLAILAATTEKQIARMSQVFVLRKLWTVHTC
jgi:hypothetical protein